MTKVEFHEKVNKKMVKRGRKVKNTNKPLSKKQQIVNDSQGLLGLFGNRIVTKYNDEYLNRLKEKFGLDDYLKHLDEDLNDFTDKYTQEYAKKNRKRNEAVVRYREKQKLFIENELITIACLRETNVKLKKELEKTNSILYQHLEMVESLKSKLSSEQIVKLI